MSVAIYVMILQEQKISNVSQRSSQSKAPSHFCTATAKHTPAIEKQNISSYTAILIPFPTSIISYLSPSSYSHITATFKASKSNIQIEDKLQQAPKVVSWHLFCCVSVEAQRI